MVRGRARAFVTQVPLTIGAVFGNPQLRRVELAYAGFSAAEWAVWVAMIVYAYDRGGATTAGLVAVLQLVPAAVFAPFAATLGDRHRSGRVLLCGYVAQALAMGATGAVLISGGPAGLVYALGACAATAVTITRPAQSALTPTLARRPHELTAANAVAGWIESLSILVAPALAGVILDTAGPGWVFAVMTFVALVSAALVWPVPGPPQARDQAAASGIVRETLEAAELLRSEPAARALVTLLAFEFVAIGALDILYAELAIGELGLSDGWAGYLNAAFGLGGVLAIVVTAALVGRRRLVPALLAGLGLWFVGFLLLGLHTTLTAAVVLLAVGGIGHMVVDVSGRTLLQRTVPANALARVFGLLESISTVGLAVGSLLVPSLVAIGGAQAALLGVGALLPLAALLVGRNLRGLDRAADVPVVEIGLLRSLPMFAALPAPELERVARALVPLDVSAGSVVIAAGEVGDRFYVIADGLVEITKDGRTLQTLGRGEGFGEIALLHDVPRTATCTATETTHLCALDRVDFLAAVTGHERAARAALGLAGERLGS